MSEHTPVVSIIMNCYNCERFLKQALDSVYAQTIDDWEIIFWDNASTDASPEIVKKYDRRLKYHCAEETTSLGEARNLALAKAQGKYIAFLDCDDLYEPEKLEKQLSLMEEHGFDLSYGGVVVIDENGNEIERRPATNSSGYLLESLLNRYEINMQTVMIRRTHLESANLTFHPEFKYCPDYNLFMQIASESPLGVMKEYVAKYRVYPESLSKTLYDRVSPEMRLTLDVIQESDDSLKSRFPEAFAFAYGKLNYYDAIFHISEGRYRDALLALASIVWRSPKFLVLYLLVSLRLPKRWILRLLRRH